MVPYSTLPSAASSVVHWTVAAVSVTFCSLTAEITGGVDVDRVAGDDVGAGGSDGEERVAAALDGVDRVGDR